MLDRQTHGRTFKFGVFTPVPKSSIGARKKKNLGSEPSVDSESFSPSGHDLP